MTVDHESVVAALFAHLEQETQSFQTTGRRVLHWTQVNAQPALFLRQIGTSDEPNHASDFIATTLECEIWIYSNTGKAASAVPGTDLNLLVGEARAAFAPDAGYGDVRFTIGGLAYHCRIEGRADYSPGDQGGQAIARIPVRITLP